MAFGFSCSDFSCSDFPPPSSALLIHSAHLSIASQPRALRLLSLLPFPECYVKLSPEVERFGAQVLLCQEQTLPPDPQGLHRGTVPRELGGVGCALLHLAGAWGAWPPVSVTALASLALAGGGRVGASTAGIQRGAAWSGAGGIWMQGSARLGFWGVVQDLLCNHLSFLACFPACMASRQG